MQAASTIIPQTAAHAYRRGRSWPRHPLPGPLSQNDTGGVRRAARLGRRTTDGAAVGAAHPRRHHPRRDRSAACPGADRVPAEGAPGARLDAGAVCALQYGCRDRADHGGAADRGLCSHARLLFVQPELHVESVCRKVWLSTSATSCSPRFSACRSATTIAIRPASS